MYVSIYACMCIYICVSICKYMYIHVFKHIHIYINKHEKIMCIYVYREREKYMFCKKLMKRKRGEQTCARELL